MKRGRRQLRPPRCCCAAGKLHPKGRAALPDLMAAANATDAREV